MKKNLKTGSEGISLHVLHIAMIICAIAISLLLIFSTYQSSNVFSTLSKATSNYIVRQKAAHDLMEASDYLTEMVQRFTLEGDTQYLDNYFEEAYNSKRREAAITSMKESAAEEVLVQQLEDAMNESMSLMYREYYAMKLVIEAKDLKDSHDEIRAIAAKGGVIQVTVGNFDRDIEIHVPIRTDLKASLQTLDKLMTTTRQNTTAELNKELTIIRVVIIILTVIILVLIWFTAKLGTVPMMKAKKCAEAGEPIPMIGSKEFRYMAKSYNKMHEKLYGSKEETK